MNIIIYKYNIYNNSNPLECILKYCMLKSFTRLYSIELVFVPKNRVKEL